MNQSEEQAFNELKGKVTELVAKVDTLLANQAPPPPADNTPDIQALTATVAAEAGKLP